MSSNIQPLNKCAPCSCSLSKVATYLGVALLVMGVVLVMISHLAHQPLLFLPGKIGCISGGVLVGLVILKTVLNSCCNSLMKTVNDGNEVIKTGKGSTGKGSTLKPYRRLAPLVSNKPTENKAEIVPTENKTEIISVKEQLSKKSIVGLEEAQIIQFEGIVTTIQNKTIQNDRSLSPEKGLILSGPPGTGKSSTAQALAELLTTKDRIRVANLEGLKSPYLGESEMSMATLLEPEPDNKFFVLIVEEADAFIPNRKKVNGIGSASNALTSQANIFLDKMDQLTKQGIEFFVILTTNYAEKFDEALTRPGRFGTTIQMQLPSSKGREVIFENYLTPLKNKNLVEENIDVKHLARETVGFSGAHLKGVVDSANREALRTNASQITMKHLLKAIEQQKQIIRDNNDKNLSPPYKRLKSSSKTTINMINSVDELQGYLKQEGIVGLSLDKIFEIYKILAMAKDRETFKKRGISIEKGLILSGPPGTGKTTLAKALAQLFVQGEKIRVASPSALRQSHHGDSEKAMEALFEPESDRSFFVLLIDEADSLLMDRSKMNYNRSDAGATQASQINIFLKNMDGIENEEQNFFVILMTNHKGKMDEALSRPGRFGAVIELSLPELNERKMILAHYLSQLALKNLLDTSSFTKTNATDNFALRMTGFSGDHIKHVVENANTYAFLRSNNKDEKVTPNDLEFALTAEKRKIENLQKERFFNSFSQI